MARADASIPWWVFPILMTAAYFVWPRPSAEKVQEADRALAAAKSQWAQLQERWRREASVHAFVELKQSLASARAELQLLPAERAKKLAKLKSEQEAFQRRRYLDRFRIDRGSIRGIGVGRAATLASFGIETAYDVTSNAVAYVPGFGPTLTDELLSWRRQHEANFRFNPNEPIDAGEVRRVEAETAVAQQKLTATLQRGVGRLRALPAEIAAGRQRLEPLMKEGWDRFKLAEARRRAL